MKLTTITRGILSTGSLGYGYILARPAVASDGNLITYTIGSYTGGSTAPITTSGAATAYANPTTSPYVQSLFGPANTQLKVRCVSSGLRVKYVGTKLNQGGRIVSYSSADNCSLDGTTFSNLIAFPRATITQADQNKWAEVVYIPQDSNSLEWVASPDTPNGNPFMVIAMSSAVGTQPFMYEMISHFEIIGTIATALTPNPPGNEALVSTIVGSLSNHNAAGFSYQALTTVMQAIPTLMVLYRDVQNLYANANMPRPPLLPM
jgi:hypothetical protein